ncbi:hypothetical protein IFR04_003602 [Cadophora malorum]|uniref:3-hydroxyisobutyrate dehydrogenase protein n=1 Tax=Cadophora malorum TaxID=108018 RepID=A0A8H7WE66_9HELO|nr:hypothetical protein IFR04_003602 [Cadophora malorum]
MEYENHASSTVDISKHFDGSRGWFKGFRYQNPTLRDVEKDGPLAPAPQHFHRDVLKRETYRPRDLARYISPTFGKPYHMLVQAAPGPNLQPPGEWRRRSVGGNAPTLLRVATWAIKMRDDEIENIALAIGKSILVVPVILFLVAWPIGGGSGAARSMYLNFPNRCYEYPKHALNALDAAPNAPKKVRGQRDDDGDKEYLVKGEQSRLVRPRALVVCRNGRWETVTDGSYTGLYIFISFAAAEFSIPGPTSGDPNLKVLDEQTLDTRARRLAQKHGVQAYWCDYHCRALQQPEATDDVHRFCDVVRGAHQICIVLPNSSQEFPDPLVFFGERLWCLPEVLLSRNHKVMLCTPGPKGLEDDDFTELVDIMEMVHRCWAVKIGSNGRLERDFENEENFRLLAEHYTGTLSLSRLELIQVGLAALRSRKWREFQGGDMAYALMTLLSKRPRMDPTDTELQALARLSLANDSDRIVERMLCMDQRRLPGSAAWFNTTDDLGANLWDIEPLAQVAGVCHDGSIIIDGCHGISIRWKDIPRINFLIRETWKKAWAAYALRSGPLWFIIGAVLAAIPSTRGIGAFFLVLGILLLVSAPRSITVLYGGKVWGATPWLIGFEGTLPLEEIEHMTFGNSIGRFTYTPSSGPYCSKLSGERIGADPSVNFSKLPKGHRLFTLIDTGTMTVTVFAAARPPSVALLCGKEGGMLRAVLCSYERSTNSLVKECVLRMETPMWDQSSLMGWTKLS